MTTNVPCETADDRYRPIFPGRPGESLEAFLIRANAEFAAALQPDFIMPALNRSRDRYDSEIVNRPRGRGWAS